MLDLSLPHCCFPPVDPSFNFFLVFLCYFLLHWWNFLSLFYFSTYNRRLVIHFNLFSKFIVLISYHKATKISVCFNSCSLASFEAPEFIKWSMEKNGYVFSESAVSKFSFLLWDPSLCFTLCLESASAPQARTWLITDYCPVEF